MGLIEARTRALACLKDGRILHEARDNIGEKNLLQTGAVDVDQVIKLLNATKGSEYTNIAHSIARKKIGQDTRVARKGWGR